LFTNEGTFLMKTHRPSRYVILRTGGSVRSARRALSARKVRARATNGILAPALMLVSLGAGAAASPGHGIDNHVRASAHQPVHSLAHRARAGSARPCRIDSRLWVYAAIEKMPWMYAGINKMPWMYAPQRHASSARVCVIALPLSKGAHIQGS
jgi:hypothetical protein